MINKIYSGPVAAAELVALNWSSQTQFLAVDLSVGEAVAGILKQRSKADVHEILLAWMAPKINMAKPILHTAAC